MNGISVIICCYNSVPRLPATLRHLAAQEAGALAWEVVLVDNNSTDATADVARQQWQQLGSPAPLAVVAEPRPGLSMARAAGLAAAHFDLVVFCDDDNWLAADYLRQAHELMQQDAQTGILGGLNTAVADGPLPAWFQQVEHAYACGPQADQDGEVSPERLYVAGAGMVVRRRIFAELARAGFQSQLLDRKGEELSSGGDTELCFATALLGYKVVYSSRLKLFHYMEAKRLTWDYLINLNNGHARSYYKLQFYKQAYANKSIQSSWFRHLLSNSRQYMSKKGAYLIVNKLFNKNQVGNSTVAYTEFDFQVWKMHLHSFAEFKKLTAYLNQFVAGISKRRAQ